MAAICTSSAPGRGPARGGADRSAHAWIADEAQSLLARLSRIRPLVVQETMTPAAAPAARTQRAIEGSLALDRARLGRRLVQLLAALDTDEAKRMPPALMHQRLVHVRLMFNDALSNLDLFVDAMSQRSERDTGLWLAGLDVVADDVLAFGDVYDAPPVLCYLDRGPGAAIRRARTRLPGGGANPVALIQIPRERMTGTAVAASLAHETGHQAAALLELLPDLRDHVQATLPHAPQWHRWISEIVADLWALSRLGPTATLGLIGVLSLPAAFVARLGETDPHPPAWLRVPVLSTMLLRPAAPLVLALVVVAGGCFDPTDPTRVETNATTGAGGDDEGTTMTASTTMTGATSADDDTTTIASGESSAVSVGPDTATATGTASDTQEDSDSTSSADDDDSGEPSCDGACVPELPAGWQGPVVVHDDAAPPCPDAFPQAVHEARFAGLQPGDASCSCTCGDVVGASCGNATLREEGNLCVLPVANPDQWVLSPGACTFIDMSADDYGLYPTPLQTAGASCSPQADVDIPTPQWDREVRSCAAPVGDACKGGTCSPAVPRGYSMCIYAEGDAACPEGAFSERLVTHTGYDDDRGCSACSCGAPVGTCGGTAVLTNVSCGANGFYVGDVAAGSCGPRPAATHAQWLPEVDAACTPSGGALVGAAAPTDDAVTYCCQ